MVTGTGAGMDAGSDVRLADSERSRSSSDAESWTVSWALPNNFEQLTELSSCPRYE